MATLSLTVKAQSIHVTDSSGGYFRGEIWQLSFTVGESVIETYQGSQIIFTQGFHQPQLIVTELNELAGIDLQIKVYPNPVTDLLNLTVNEDLPQGSIYQRYNVEGAPI